MDHFQLQHSSKRPIGELGAGKSVCGEKDAVPDRRRPASVSRGSCAETGVSRLDGYRPRTTVRCPPGVRPGTARRPRSSAKMTRADATRNEMSPAFDLVSQHQSDGKRRSGTQSETPLPRPLTDRSVCARNGLNINCFFAVHECI